jgi:CxxC motif-containing protein
MEENDKNRTLTCITCPVGCTLTVSMQNGDFVITGNRCPRGAAYAREELTAPKRVVTATAALIFDGGPLNQEPPVRRVPVRTSAACPRERINDLLRDIYALKVSLPVRNGQPLLRDWQGRGFDVVATRTLGV